VGDERRRRLKAVGIAVGTGILLSAPLLWIGGRTLGGAVGEASAPGWKQPTLPATDITLFLRPGAHYFPDTPAMGNPGILHVHYLGWVLVGLAVWAFWKHPDLRRHRWAAITWAVASLGPAAAFAGTPVGNLPLAALYRIPYSPWSYVHHPYRLVAFTLPFAALAAAAVLSTRGRWIPVLAAAGILVETLFVSSAPWPLATTDMTLPASVAAIPGDGGVMDWPPDGSAGNRLYTLWQVSHGRPIPYGLNTFLPEPLLSDPLVVDLLGVLDDLKTREKNRDVPRKIKVGKASPEGETELRAWGLNWIVLHADDLTEDERAKTTEILTRRLGDPVGEGTWAVR